MFDATTLNRSEQYEFYTELFKSFAFGNGHSETRRMAHELGRSDETVRDCYRWAISFEEEIKKGQRPNYICLTPSGEFKSTGYLTDVLRPLLESTSW